MVGCLQVKIQGENDLNSPFLEWLQWLAEEMISFNWGLGYRGKNESVCD